MGQSPTFIHLHIHSAYSLLEGAINFSDMINYATNNMTPAIGIADSNNLFGAFEFSQKMIEAGIQPLVGCELTIIFPDEQNSQLNNSTNDDSYHNVNYNTAIVLLAANQDGYLNLSKLISTAYGTINNNKPVHIDHNLLDDANTKGLIALTGGREGPIDSTLLKNDNDELARARLSKLASVFDNRLYVELQRHDRKVYSKTEPYLLKLASDLDLPVVATNEPFFPDSSYYDAHDALLCIAQGCTIEKQERRRLTPEHYLKTPQQMAELFNDLPQAVANTIEIARKCSLIIEKHKTILPRFNPQTRTSKAQAGNRHKNTNANYEINELRQQAVAGLGERLKFQEPPQGKQEKDYQQRLDNELTIIEQMGFAGYFLIVADFVKWARGNDIPVGPGRGSGTGSLVAYALTITDIDPLRFNLIFERFLNPERVSMPDFDIDFCQDRRDEVIHYVRDKYGHDNVAHIITFGTMQARAVTRDVGRVFGLPYSQVNRICKIIPFNATSLTEAITNEAELQKIRADDDNIAQLFDAAQKLEGLYRHASTHAAGIVIADRPLMELLPLYRDPKADMLATQFSMKWVEKLGLVKFDFLGLKTLTVIKQTVDMLKQGNIDIEIDKLPLDDKKTFTMLSRGETVGVFQIESSGMRRTLIDMQADRIEDIIALISLYRPGPMANIPSYCNRKNGIEPIDYIHPLLEPVLKDTFGVIVYQEDVMQIAQALAGYSLGEADLLRRAMGKKIRSEMAVQRQRFISGATKNGVDRHKASMIFDLMAPFGDYGFNKNHATGYAMIAYQTAYLKANYPIEFIATSMTMEIGNTDKIDEFRREGLRMGIAIKAACINSSMVTFAVKNQTIHYALAAIKGVGHNAAQHIVSVRNSGTFTDIVDFATRVNTRIVTKRTLEALINAGAFDCFDNNRARFMASLNNIISLSQRTADDKTSGQLDMFGQKSMDISANIKNITPWPLIEQLNREQQALGFYFSGHPLEDYADHFVRAGVELWQQFSERTRNRSDAGKLAGMLDQRREKRTRTGNKIIILTFSDPSGQFEAIIYGEDIVKYQTILEVGKLVTMNVSIEWREGMARVRIHGASPIARITDKIFSKASIFIRQASSLPQLSQYLNTLKDGSVTISLNLLLPASEPNAKIAEVELTLAAKYRLNPENIKAIKSMTGIIDARLD